MKLSRAAKYFDKQPVYDLAGNLLFKAQFELYNDGTRDVTGADRRIMSYDPALPAPPKVVQVDGSHFLVGHAHDDYWGGATLRRKYVVQGAPTAFKLYQIGELLTGAIKPTTWGSAEWYKDWRDDRVTSRPRFFFNVYTATTEPCLPDTLAVDPTGRIYLSQGQYETSSGLSVAEAVGLPVGTQQTVNVSGKTFDPATGGYTTLTAAPVLGLWMRFKDDYDLFTSAASGFEPGDARFWCLRSSLPVVQPNNHQIVQGGRSWNILHAYPQTADSWLLHVRPA